MNARQVLFAGCLLLLALATAPRVAQACPFCASVSQTFSEEMNSMDVVCIAELVHRAPPPVPGVYTEPELSRFRVLTYLKGEELHEGDTIETIYLGGGEIGDRFLTMGIDPTNLMWSSPLPVNDRVITYLEKLPSLPAEGVERLRYFQEFLEDEDELLTRDAYDEFALAPYDVIIALGPYMDHDQLIAWIHDPNVPANRRRLYLTMLGVCGSTSDLPMLEEMLQSREPHLKSGLDAMIACYLTLAGAEGLPLVENLFLKSYEPEMTGAYAMLAGTPWQYLAGETLLEYRKPEYADTYSAIMALRFHGTDADVLEREDILHSLHFLLDRPKLADLVIPDLARWEDWSVADRLVELFREADAESNWVRVPIVNYMRACPLPEAAEHMELFREIDSKAVEDASIFFRPGGGQPTADPATSSSVESESPPLIAGIDPAELAALEAAEAKAAASASPQPAPAPAADSHFSPATYRLMWLSVAALGAIMLLAAFRRRAGNPNPTNTA